MASELASALLRRARAWAGQITSKSKALAPKHLKSHIHSSAKETKEGHITIITYVDRSEDGKPNYGTKDAHAQEFGSGIYARRGKKGEYPIRPKTTFGSLAFFENAGGTWDYEMIDPPMPRARAPDGRGLFYGVWHPGIQAANGGRGYIGPVWNAVRQKAKEELLADGSKAIKLALNRSFKGK